MKKIFLITSFLLIVLSAESQIIGRVVDEKALPMSFVNVVLLNRLDSTFIEGTVTNEDGTFTINTDQNDGLLKVSSIGYRPMYIYACQGNVGDIQMQPDSQMLDEVVVNGNVPFHVLTSEGLQTNVENTVLSRLGTANDILEYVPGIQKDGDGYNVFGKGAPVFYINGRLVRDLRELDQISSEDIKNIELITNPGAKYDATVRSVVKIKMKRPQGDGLGFNNRLVLGQSKYTDLLEELNVNYRYHRLDIFGKTYYSKDRNYNYSTLEQDIQADTIWHQSNANNFNYCHKRIGFMTGLNYVINDNNSFGFRYEFDQQLHTEENSSFSSFITANGTFYDKLGTLSIFQNHSRPTHTANFYYNGMIDGFTIDFNADWKQNDKNYDGAYTETSKEFSDRLLNTSSHIRNRLYALKLVTGHQLFGGNLEVGAEYTHTDRDDDYISLEDYLPSSYTKLKERSIAPFIEYSYRIPIGIIKGGIRYEHAVFNYYSKGKYMNQQSRTFGNIFPNISVMAKIGNVQGIVGYTAKIRRPNYSELNGNITYANRFTLQTGNPLLNPSIIHDFSLNAMCKIWNISIDYSDTRNAIIDWVEQQDDNTAVSVLSKKNINSLKKLTTTIVAAPKIGVWNPQFVAGMSKQWLTLHTDNGIVKMNDPIFIAQMANIFQFSNSFSGNITMKFTSTGDEKNISLQRNMFQTNVSLTKTFFNDRLSVRLAGYDLFLTKMKIKLFNQQMQMIQDKTNDTRYAEITIRYKFNNTRRKYKGTGAGNDEKDRL